MKVRKLVFLNNTDSKMMTQGGLFHVPDYHNDNKGRFVIQ